MKAVHKKYWYIFAKFISQIFQSYFMYRARVNEGESLTMETKEDILHINGEPFQFDSSEISSGYLHIIKDQQSIITEVVKADYKSKTFQIKVKGRIHTVTLQDKMDLLLEKMGISSADDQALKDIKAPMPGLILDIMVENGQAINKGEPLMILEAMKMENVLKSPGDGVIKSIEVQKGQSVEKNQVLINF